MDKPTDGAHVNLLLDIAGDVPFSRVQSNASTVKIPWTITDPHGKVAQRGEVTAHRFADTYGFGVVQGIGLLPPGTYTFRIGLDDTPRIGRTIVVVAEGPTATG